jgi:rare lipoprotein A
MSRLQNILLTVIVLLLAACSSAPVTRSGMPNSSPKSSPVSIAATNPAQSGQPAPNLPKAGSGRGAYYKDDGPGDNPPPGLELTLDAEPKIEPYSISGNKPYVVFGKTYTPMLDDKPFTERGTGSWYGKKFHGQKTSSGELYDMYKMTAAHPTLPIPSYARITNLANG